MEIINNEEHQQFELHQDGQMAKLEYKIKNNFLYLMHTEVPKALSGRGLASKLAVHALEYGRSNELPIKVYCPFVAAYLKRNLDQLVGVEGIYVEHS